MGLKSKSKIQIQTHIRACAADSALVILTKHAKARMRERKINFPEVMDCLLRGSIRIEPEEDMRTGCLICRMERYTSGRQLAVSVALDDEDPSLIVVTVMVID